MTTLQGKGKVIQYSFNEVIHECAEGAYIAELPLIICNNAKDAETIQKETQAFVSALSKKLIKEGEKNEQKISKCTKNKSNKTN